MSCRKAPISSRSAIDRRIERRDARDQLHQVDDVLEQSAEIGVMVLHAGRRPAELAHELFVDQKALGQVEQVRVAHLAQKARSGGRTSWSISLEPRVMKSSGSTSLVRRLANAGGDQLDRALEELRRAFDAHVVAVLEVAIVLLAGVPHPGADRAAAVGQFDLQIQVAVAIGPQLLVGGQEDLVDRLPDEPIG